MAGGMGVVEVPHGVHLVGEGVTAKSESPWDLGAKVSSPTASTTYNRDFEQYSSADSWYMS